MLLKELALCLLHLVLPPPDEPRGGIRALVLWPCSSYLAAGVGTLAGGHPLRDVHDAGPTLQRSLHRLRGAPASFSADRATAAKVSHECDAVCWHQNAHHPLQGGLSLLRPSHAVPAPRDAPKVPPV